jgi:hypothetical protein
MAILYQDSGSFYDLEVTSSLRATGSLFGTASWANNTLLDVAATNSTNNAVSQLYFGGGGNVTFGLNGMSITATAPTGGGPGGGSVNISAGTTSNDVSQLVFSNSNGISFGLDGSTITAQSAAPLESWYDPYPVWQGTSTTTFNNSQMLLNPVVIPFDVSVSYLRLPATFAFGQTSIASSAGITVLNLTNGFSWSANIYTRNTGANSNSLSYLFGSRATGEYRVSVSANGSSCTVNYNLTLPATGSTYTFFTSNTTQGASYSVVSSNAGMTGIRDQLSGNRWIDIPFATSLSGGDYYIGIYRSSSSGTAGISNMSNATLNNTFYYLTQANISMLQPGASSNISSQQLKPALGYYSNTNTTNFTTAIATSVISSTASNLIIPFQLVRIT